MSTTAPIIDLSVGQLAMALLLVAAIVVVSIRQSLGLERDLAVGTVRAIVQLYVVGLILAAVFAAARWYWVLLILGVMTGWPRRRRCLVSASHCRAEHGLPRLR